jgi:hypothetical protein
MPPEQTWIYRTIVIYLQAENPRFKKPYADQALVRNALQDVVSRKL